jgi:hypothetical protein
MLQKAVLGQEQMPPLGVLGTQLRNIYDSSINADAFNDVVSLTKAMRNAQPQV